MSAKIRFHHRQPPAGWTDSNSEIEIHMRIPVDSTVFLAQEMFDTVTNLSTKSAPEAEELDGLIYKSGIILDQLRDISSMLDSIQSAK